MATKRDDILRAGAEVFLREGFSAASVNDIAERANVSKRTLYKYFESKTELFGAIIVQQCDHLGTALHTSTPSDPDPHKTLTTLARRYLDLVLSPAGLDLRRIVIAEAKRFPELGRVFIGAGAQRTNQALADYLTEQNEAGILRIPDPNLAAEQFFGLIVGSLRLHAYYDPGIATRGEILTRWIESSVTLYLRGYGFEGVKNPQRAPRRRIVASAPRRAR